MKKIEIIKELGKMGYEPEDYKDLSWIDLQDFYKDKTTPSVEKPTEESVDETIERLIEKQPDMRTPLEKKRDELFPRIVDIMRRLRGRTNATHDELNEMFAIYNTFFMRHDSPGCGACVARVYKTFEKMTKGHL